MKILDRYVARQYLTNILSLYVILFAFVVTIDVAMNLDHWHGGREAVAGRGDGRRPAVRADGAVDRRLLVAQAPPLFNTPGLVLAGAMGFTCVQMVRHREPGGGPASGQSAPRGRPGPRCRSAHVARRAQPELYSPRVAPLLAREHKQAGMRTAGSRTFHGPRAGPAPVCKTLRPERQIAPRLRVHRTRRGPPPGAPTAYSPSGDGNASGQRESNHRTTAVAAADKSTSLSESRPTRPHRPVVRQYPTTARAWSGDNSANSSARQARAKAASAIGSNARVTAASPVAMTNLISLVLVMLLPRACRATCSPVLRGAPWRWSRSSAARSAQRRSSRASRPSSLYSSLLVLLPLAVAVTSAHEPEQPTHPSPHTLSQELDPSYTRFATS